MATLTLAVARRRSWLALAALHIALLGVAVVARPAPAVLPASTVIGTVTFSNLAGGAAGTTLAIPIKSYAWSVSKTPSSTGSSKAVFSKFTFTKALDAASPLLFRATALALVSQTVTVRIYDPGTTTIRAVYSLGNALVASVSDAEVSNSTSSQTETVGLLYSTVTESWNKTPTGGSVSYCFNLPANTTC